MRLYVFLLSLVICQWSLVTPAPAAQPYVPVHPDPVLESYRWRTFPELKGKGLRAMAEDRDGNIWFGVDDGAIRYDGTTWTTFTEEDGVGSGGVSYLFGMSDGTVYAATHDGISQFEDGQWRHVFPPEGDLAWNINDLMETSDGRLWAASGWGAIRKDPDGWTLFAPEEIGESLRALAPYVSTLVVPRKATSMIPWGANGLLGLFGYPFYRENLTVLGLAPGGPAAQAGLKLGDRIRAEDGKPVRWMVRSVFSGLLTVQRPSTNTTFEVTLERRELEGGFRGFPVYEIFEDRDGLMWFGLVQGQIARFDPTADRRGEGSMAWQLFDSDDGMAEGYLPRMAQTSGGDIWSVSEQTSFPPNRYDGDKWQPVVVPGTDLRQTSILTTVDGQLWIGSGGLQVLRNGQWTRYGRADGLPVVGHRQRLLATSDGALWTAPLGGHPARLDHATPTYASYEDLSYQCESEDGATWFIHEDGRVVRNTGNSWTSYGTEDGLMDLPARLIVDRRGRLWAAGSHAHTAATAVFDGSDWSMTMHPDLSFSIDSRAAYESSDGSLWFGSVPDWRHYSDRGFKGGLMRFHDGEWTHQVPPDAPSTSYGFGEDSHGRLWASGGRTYRLDDDSWTAVVEPDELTDFVDVVYTGPDALWFGSRIYGALRFDGESWTLHNAGTGLVGNRVLSITEVTGTVLVSTDEGVSRFDGKSWTTPGLPAIPGHVLRTARDGSIWITWGAFNAASRAKPDYAGGREPELSVIRYQPDNDVPGTEIVTWADEVSQPGNTTIVWTGADPWKATPKEELQYSFRVDENEWSPYARETTRIFQSLPSGHHTFEVRARDRDFNVDPTPASIAFTVIPPVYQQTWFIALMIAFVSVTVYQASRIIVSNRRLTEGNEALSGANHQLFDLNVALQRERAVERVRAEVTSMTAAEDLQPVVQDMLKELATAGVGFDLCVINIIDEGASARRQYGATAKGWSGQTETSMAEVSEAFLTIWKSREPAVRETDEELVRSCLLTRQALGVTDALDRPAFVIDAPFAYGTLSLQSSRPDGFSEEDVALVAEFARVIQLGYARYLDFQNLERQNAELQRDRAVERIRTEVQSMDRVEDFERVLSRLTEDLTTVGLTFESCEIDVLEEPLDRPSIDYFTERGFRYTTYTLDPEGHVESEAFSVNAPFPGVIRETVERFIEGEPWFGTSQGKSIVEVPAASYGRLRLTTSEDSQFAEGEVATLREFAAAIALGYARYLDIREIQLQTERKSAFLASMSHEFRTPMNAIKGFTNLVLNRERSISDRGQENLQKVSQASDHLLAMINDLLDLSKIEAGRMDVNAETFDIAELVTSCCDTVSPLIQDGVTLRRDVSDEIGEAHTDRARVQQMVINLLSNAIKFTDEGRVVVTARRQEAAGRRQKENQAASMPASPAHDQRPTDNGDLVIAVTDTGKGIPEDELPTLFDEYRQVAGQSASEVQKGTGLGLSITKKFAELLGGRVEVESEVGTGTTFTITIPSTYVA